MRISGTPGLASIIPAGPVSDAQSPQPVIPQAAHPALESDTLQPALTALRAMPNIDQAKVAALRVALAKGEVPFDAAKLAGLIERFHGSTGGGA